MENEFKPIDPNTADLKTLQALPGIGESLAQRIIEARPFESLEELTDVPGLGEKTLARLSSFLTLKSAPEPKRVEAAVSKKETPPTAPSGFTRTQTLWIALLTAGASVILSLALTMAILVGVNRTLSVARHASIRNLDAEVRALEVRVDEVSSTLQRLDQRLKAVEGLSGRMTAMESEVQTSLDEVDQAVEQLHAMESEVKHLREQATRTESFFEALSQLLAELLLTGGMSP